MKLYHVRKGQFVYYNNALHRVYGVKPMYKKSVHLIRLRDLTQHLTSAAQVERYKPKLLDSFIYDHKVYTLRKRNANEGETILITNPTPDSLDHYSLNEIEVVEKADNKGVITSNSNGIKHHEYLLMELGRDAGSNPIDFLDNEHGESENGNDFNNLIPKIVSGDLPAVGDVYRNTENDTFFETMVLAIRDETVYLGGGLQLLQDELMNSEKWELLYHLHDK
ncbi:hypothetical protein WQ54_24605 [Bacillus sp. SA1-12]|uniref:hypothetical protein n=1 Tax=Bacillus sp. SA1-12 TaxID=1455638 RepID=UPI0006272AF9|nr:hypothetical protein [Bacillus sp. SA1-12]KKI89548.1 hypothetical protein WQ54_24605 [Bacillus sp. SA1-12]